VRVPSVVLTDYIRRLRQYRSRISQWGKDKNVKSQEMEAIVRKRQKRILIETNKSQLIFEVRGSQVEPQKIERWMKRHEVADSFLYAPSPAACKLVPARRLFFADVPKPRRLLSDATLSPNEALLH
jgi:hypothetical protein